ncbi:site-specific DNA-methyltransferase [Anaerobacillus alkaliphilus]|uniref:Site-specific DNA-methyltransferase n=1 Tax=Anaerobacillus alkaliphilus TaxID=1548597 RepID=A0A4V1LFS5_9BACI|nr:site-specific DNA-methyltransferase [Anaerobacillus alkaliphilus]RXI96309.1 site-specific DNA-methyltransferase [Anaerobacillus alkaliphilus]
MLKDKLRYNEEVKPNTAILMELKEKLPEFFTANKYDEDGNLIEECKFDLEKFQHALKDNNINTLSSGNRLEFIGKDYAKKQVGESSTTVIVPDNDHNNAEKNKRSKNLFFTGDNLEVLRHLQNNYNNLIDMIYIDPPYNTGSDGFVYPDKFEYSDQVLKNMFGLNDTELKRLKSIQGKATHSAWLTFMYPRLWLSKRLLTEEGVVFISVDDNEQTNTKILCDELFGEGNFLGQIILQTATDNNPTQIATEHEYMLCYAKNKGLLEPWYAKSQGAEQIQDKYKSLVSKYGSDIDTIQKELRTWIKVNKDELPRVTHYDNVDLKGVFHDGDIANTKFGGYEFEIIHPVTKKPVKIPPKGYRYPESTLREMIKNDDIVFGKDETVLIKPKKRLENVKDLLRTIIYEDGRTSTNRVNQLVGKDVFNNPKSDRVLKRLLEFVLSNKKDSIILDFFAGSATTADAVMQLNADDNGMRQFIMVQLPERTYYINSDGIKTPKKGSESAFKAGYMSIDEISRERIKRASEKIQEESGSTLPENFDGGFKHYRVVSPEQPTLDDLESFDMDTGQFIDSSGRLKLLLESGFDDMIQPFSSEGLKVDGNSSGQDTIKTTWLVSDGYKLDIDVEKVDLKGYQAFYVGSSRLYLINEHWRSEQTRELLNIIGTNKLTVQTIVIYGYSFDLESIRELEIGLKQLNSKVNLVKRY